MWRLSTTTCETSFAKSVVVHQKTAKALWHCNLKPWSQKPRLGWSNYACLSSSPSRICLKTQTRLKNPTNDSDTCEHDPPDPFVSPESVSRLDWMHMHVWPRARSNAQTCGFLREQVLEELGLFDDVTPGRVFESVARTWLRPRIQGTRFLPQTPQMLSCHTFSVHPSGQHTHHVRSIFWPRLLPDAVFTQCASQTAVCWVYWLANTMLCWRTPRSSSCVFGKTSCLVEKLVHASAHRALACAAAAKSNNLLHQHPFLADPAHDPPRHQGRSTGLYASSTDPSIAEQNSTPSCSLTPFGLESKHILRPGNRAVAGSVVVPYLRSTSPIMITPP